MNFKFRLLIILLTLFAAQPLLAQQSEDVIIEEIIESVVANQTEDYDYTELVERLNFYKKNKINLNKTNKEQLQELVFLNPLQISALLEHIAENGKLISDLELQSVNGFDLETIKRLLYFADISAPTGFENFSFKKLLSDGKNDLLLRYSRYLETQKGFTIPASSGKSRYLGTPERVFTRYRFSFSNNIQFSLNVEKDAGERYWNTTNGQKGPDFVSSSLYVKDLKRFKKIAIGDYSLQFGQGLTLWSGLGFGKGADIFSVTKQDLGLRPYTSVNEFSFFRGIATQINFGKFDFTPFISYNKLDAGIDLNPLTNLEDISSLQQSGLHRTENELKNRRRVSQLVFGGNLQYNYKKLSLGLTGYHSKYSQSFAPGSSLYNKFDFTGNKLDNVGFNYSYTLNNTYFFGEVAHSVNYGFSYINGLISSLSPIISAVLFHRNYQKNYYSFYNQGIGESSTAVNEKGFYAGLQIKPNRKFGLDFYTDLFKFPWLKFGVDAPSSGYDMLAQFNYTPNKVTRFTLRYQFQNKQKNLPEVVVSNTLGFEKKSNYRAEVQYQINNSFSLRNRVEVVQYHQETTQPKFGFLAYQDVSYSPLSSKWSGNIRLTLFDTEDFDTRIYAYENDVLYGFSIPGFQNQGTRFYTNLRYNLKRGIDLWLKYSYTKFNNASTVGSGLDEIQGDSRSELKLQMRYQF
ncbi:MAG TPA: helix-hairpin-helix domain-containing protein [Pelobium sp.]